MENQMGVRVLLVEENALVAVAIEDVLVHAGYSVVGPFRASGGTPPAVAEQVDVALLDVPPREGASFALAAELAREGVPFAFMSADRELFPAAYRNAPFLAKAFGARQLLETVSTLAADSSQLPLSLYNLKPPRLPQRAGRLSFCITSPRCPEASLLP
jgi:DNA-binding NarL/FixJ family response regulator